MSHVRVPRRPSFVRTTRNFTETIDDDTSKMSTATIETVGSVGSTGLPLTPFQKFAKLAHQKESSSLSVPSLARFATPASTNHSNVEISGNTPTQPAVIPSVLPADDIRSFHELLTDAYLTCGELKANLKTYALTALRYAQHVGDDQLQEDRRWIVHDAAQTALNQREELRSNIMNLMNTFEVIKHRGSNDDVSTCISKLNESAHRQTSAAEIRKTRTSTDTEAFTLSSKILTHVYDSILNIARDFDSHTLSAHRAANELNAQMAKSEDIRLPFLTATSKGDFQRTELKRMTENLQEKLGSLLDVNGLSRCDQSQN